MFSSSNEATKSNSPESRFTVAREMPRRIAHGDMGWATTSTSEGKLSQPQDGAEPRSR